MPKMKSHRGAAKRFKKSGTGKVMAFKAYKRHLLTGKSSKTKRNLDGARVLHPGDAKRVASLIYNM